MAHNERPGPLPSLQGVGNSVPRMANRFAKRDPQLYPVSFLRQAALPQNQII